MAETSTRPSRLKRLRSSLLGVTTSAVLALSGIAVAPTIAQAAPAEGTVAGATLDWGIKASFRSYLLGPIAHGNIELLGNTTADENMRTASSRFHWAGGTGTAATDGSAVDAGFGAGNGVHLTGHEMTVDDETAPALDMTFTNPRVEVASATEGTLYLDVKSRKFEGMTSISQEFFEEQNVPVATLALSAPAADGATFTWTDAAATLTESGAEAFGGFYNAGDALDPVTFTVPVEEVVEEPEPAAPSFTAEVTEVPDERVDIAITGSGYDDVQALPGQAAPHAYFMLRDKSVDLSEISETDTAISATVAEDGTLSDTLSVPAEELDETKSYEVISWPSRSFPTEATLYARADVTIDWDALFPEEEEPAPVYDPQLTVAPATDLDPEGDTVTVSGEGYNPNQAIYVFLCGDIDLPANLWDHALQCRDGAKVVYPHDDTNPTRAKFDENGSFEVDFNVKQLDEGATAVFTAANHTAPQNREQDAKAVLEFATVEEPAPVADPQITVTPSEDLDPAVENVLEVEGTGYVGDGAANGAYVVFGEKAHWAGEGALPADGWIAMGWVPAADVVDGAFSTTLTIPAGTLDPAKEYHVATSAAHGLSATDRSLDAFHDVTVADEEEPAPETPSIEVNGSENASVKQGEDITFSLSPVEEGAEYAVTVHSDPIELDERAIGDADGVASVGWSVPADFPAGEHRVVFEDVVTGDTFESTFAVTAADTDPGENPGGENPGGENPDSENPGGGNPGGETPAGQAGNPGAKGLANTGANDLQGALVLAGLALALGAGLMLARRRAAAE